MTTHTRMGGLGPLIIWCGLVAVGALGLVSLVAHSQPPAPSPAQLEEKAQAEERAMVIIRQRELEMTRLVALYANRVDKLTEEKARLQIELDAKPACPPVPEQKESN